ncbi:MAG: SpoIIIAA, partial [uncultured Thermomicrobiales bacterium]
EPEPARADDRPARCAGGDRTRLPGSGHRADAEKRVPAEATTDPGVGDAGSARLRLALEHGNADGACPVLALSSRGPVHRSGPGARSGTGPSPCPGRRAAGFHPDCVVRGGNGDHGDHGRCAGHRPEPPIAADSPVAARACRALQPLLTKPRPRPVPPCGDLSPGYPI